MKNYSINSNFILEIRGAKKIFVDKKNGEHVNTTDKGL